SKRAPRVRASIAARAPSISAARSVNRPTNSGRRREGFNSTARFIRLCARTSAAPIDGNDVPPIAPKTAANACACFAMFRFEEPETFRLMKTKTPRTLPPDKTGAIKHQRDRNTASSELNVRRLGVETWLSIRVANHSFIQRCNVPIARVIQIEECPCGSAVQANNARSGTLSV